MPNAKDYIYPADFNEALADVLVTEREKLKAHVEELEESNRNLQVDHDQYQAKYRASVANRDLMMRALVHIRSNAESMIRAQSVIGTPDDAFEAINARWTYTECNSALGSTESTPKSIL